MSGLMNMIFEVADLAVASPATVRGCGLLYCPPRLGGWRPLLTSWMATLPSATPDVHRCNQQSSALKVPFVCHVLLNIMEWHPLLTLWIATLPSAILNVCTNAAIAS